MADELKFLKDIIDEKIDEIIGVVKSGLPRYEPEPDYKIMKALGEFFSK